MAVVNVWSKVAIDVQTVLGPAKTITAISKAAVGVVSSATHGFANGAYVLLKLSGMIEADQMVVRVANTAAGTFEMEGVDTTLFNTFSSGTAQEITFGASAATVQDVNSSGGEAKEIDTTTVHQDTDTAIPGNKSALSYTFGNIWDPADPALKELKKADNVKGERCVRITFASGAKVVFNCYPTASLAPGGSKGEVVTTQTGFKLRGPINAYAS